MSRIECNNCFGLMVQAKLIMKCLEMCWHLMLHKESINISVPWLCSSESIIISKQLFLVAI